MTYAEERLAVLQAQVTRLKADPRLTKPCEACGHPGYLHENAERQFEKDEWGVFRFEAGDIVCDTCNCDWYEGDNWKTWSGNFDTEGLEKALYEIEHDL